MISKEEALTLLGLSAQATEHEIKSAFRTKALKIHPDKNKSSAAEEEFKKLNNAREILLNPLVNKSTSDEEKFNEFFSSYFQSFFSGYAQARSNKTESNSSFTQNTSNKYSKPTADSSWYIDHNFSDGEHLRLKNSHYNFSQDSLIFWNIGTNCPAITLPMKNNEKFYWAMKEKLIKYAPWSSQWSADSAVEVLIKLKLPQDHFAYESIIKIIFAEYQINSGLQDEICLKLGLNIFQSEQEFTL